MEDFVTPTSKDTEDSDQKPEDGKHPWKDPGGPSCYPWLWVLNLLDAAEDRVDAALPQERAPEFDAVVDGDAKRDLGSRSGAALAATNGATSLGEDVVGSHRQGADSMTWVMIPDL